MAKWVHRLTERDTAARTAVCANCGPVPLYLKDFGNGNHYWVCGTGYRRNKQRKRRPWRDQLEERLARLTCELCGFQAVDVCQLDVDHIVPKSRGGAVSDPNNLQVICANCHRLKSRQESR